MRATFHWCLESAVLVLVGTAHAATITYVREIVHVGQSVALTYGTGGYDLYSTSAAATTDGSVSSSPFGIGDRLTQLPAYISGITAPYSSYQSAAGFGYATIDDPTGGTVEAGDLATKSSTASQNQILTINISHPVSDFLVGYMTNIDSAGFDYPESLELSQTAGSGSAGSGLISTTQQTDGKIDLYLFEVSGALPGDAFTFSGVQNEANQGNYYFSTSGLVFSVPEPRRLCLLPMALASLVRPGRRPRHMLTNYEVP